MKRLFVHPDGRLKTGVVSVIAFLLILGLADIAFEVKNRSAREIVKIRHVFEESVSESPLLPKVEEKVLPEKVQIKDVQIKEEQPEKVQVEDVQPREVLPEKIQVKKVQSEEVQPREITPEKTVEPAPPEPEMAQKEIVEPVPVPKEMMLESKPVQDVQAVSRSVQTQPEISKFVKPDAEEQVLADIDPLVALLGDTKTDKPEETVGERDFTISDELKALAGSKKTEPSVQVSPADEFQSSVQKSDPVEKVSRDFKGTVVSDSEVRLSGKEYNAVFKSWRNAGSEDDGEKQLSFRVQNLRKNYQLLQMKPVVVRNHKYFDLHNGAPLLEKFLQEYSSLQLVVEKPWQEWGDELKRLGVRSADDFSVRYLLYGSIDRAMQHRVNKAFDCSISLGLIPAETLPEQVEIVGRVFQVSREGGGRFGVFVPRTLQTKATLQVDIPAHCFSKSSDVQMLVAAGMIQ